MEFIYFFDVRLLFEYVDIIMSNILLFLFREFEIINIEEVWIVIGVIKILLYEKLLSMMFNSFRF